MISQLQMNAHIAANGLRGDYMVVIYTLPTCPICEMIKKKLNGKQIPYEEQEFSKLPKYINTDRAPVMAIVNCNFEDIKDGIMPVDADFLFSPSEMVEKINNWEA